MNLPVITSFVVFVIAGCVDDPAENSGDKPEIVEAFVCSDNCPGPRDKYLKRIYDGITDEGDCRELGGRPYTIVGWGEHTVCLVE